MSGATDSGMVKTMGVVMGALALFAVIIMIAARLLSDGSEDPDDPLMRNALIKRIEPVAAVRTSVDDLPTAGAVAGVAATEVASAPRTTEELVNGVCAACHVAGVAGSPVIGDDAAWAARREKGLDALVASAINGIGTMPARGGSDYSDEEMKRAVQYMAGLEVDEPEAAAEAPAEEAAGAEAPAEEALSEEAPSEEAAEAEAPAVEEAEALTSDEAPAEETPTEQTTAEEAPAQDEASTAGATAVAVVGQVPEGLTDNIKTSVDNLCTTCHLAGVGGAPKMGDHAAWQERADKGMDVLTASVINGLGVMPPRGATTLTDEEIPVAIQYLMSK